MTYILTTCGLSILTNGLKGIFEPKDIFLNSNLSKEEIDKTLLDRFEEEIKKLKERIVTLDKESLKKLSAELNALLRYYKDRFNKKDYYKLLHTDTYLGQKTAEIIEYYLKSQNLNVVSYSPKDLKTSNIEEFHISLSDLVKDLSEELEGYRSSGYKIVFNLTGGFKGVNNFLQTMASLYANESIYIFENSNELLRIPRIPIKIDKRVFEDNINSFRALDIGIDIKKEELESIHKTLINQIEDEYMLSPWGEIVWQKFKMEYYQNNLLNSITAKVEYSESFKKDFDALSQKEKYQINKSIDKLENYLNNGLNLRSLRYHELKGDIAKQYSHEFYPFDGGDSRRCYCNEKDGRVVLEKIDAHLK